MIQGTRDFETAPITYNDGAAVNFLYNNIFGRALLGLLVRPCVSRFAGMILDSRMTSIFVPGFIKRNGISIEECRAAKYESFNGFFKREIKRGLRPFPNHPLDLSAPCDGKLMAYPITPDGAFQIKHSMYAIEDLLQSKELAAEFLGGVCLIFRLTPSDYHRYAYIDDGESIGHKTIEGVLHTVRPISQQRYKVFVQNAREYEVMQTDHFGKAIQMEVGALFVGRISNHKTGRTFKRGDEKGMFEFGGSTVVMLFQKNAVTLDPAIYSNTRQNKETVIRMGNTIGAKTTQGRGQEQCE